MNKILYQLLGENTEELWYFPWDLPEKTIKAFYKQYEDSDSDNFEQFMDELTIEEIVNVKDLLSKRVVSI